MHIAIDLAIAGIAVFCTWRGFRNGIVRGVCGIMALVVSIFAANMAATAYSGEFTGMLKPFVGGMIDNVIFDGDEESLLSYSSPGDENARYELSYAALRKLGLPTSAAEIVAAMASGETSLSISELAEEVTDKLSSILAYAAVFGICFTLCAIIFAVIGNLINRVFAIPGIEQLDALLGAVFGLTKGLLIIYAAALVVRYIGLVAAPTVEKTVILKYLVNINPIASILGI